MLGELRGERDRTHGAGAGWTPEEQEGRAPPAERRPRASKGQGALEPDWLSRGESVAGAGGGGVDNSFGP